MGIAHYYEPHGDTIDRFTMGVLGIEVLLGSLTFTGSLVAFGKLQELIFRSSIKGLPNQNIINFSLLGAAILCCLWLSSTRGTTGVLVVDRPGTRIWGVSGDADRRGRHADGDLAVELVLRPGRRG